MKNVFGDNFWLKKGTTFLWKHHVSRVKTRRMNYLTFKGHIEILTKGQGHDLTRKGHVAYQSIRIVSYRIVS